MKRIVSALALALFALALSSSIPAGATRHAASDVNGNPSFTESSAHPQPRHRKLMWLGIGVVAFLGLIIVRRRRGH